MVKVIQLADDGTEVAVVELDDFTIEVLYSGIAELLRQAATARDSGAAAPGDLPPEARRRREKILGRIRG